jgi:hypothetical protein
LDFSKQRPPRVKFNFQKGATSDSAEIVFPCSGKEAAGAVLNPEPNNGTATFENNFNVSL